ncbi:hypothetical protein [Mesorhizobium sp. WSM3224]|uniref:hypothetical protein n=1 Tax=Mesorhizobium sp. WSM3224 TaxID=1040986 RepID=UPI0004857810|nr:hypothetical protein [Mesorhizobium sp. WSM3224]
MEGSGLAGGEQLFAAGCPPFYVYSTANIESQFAKGTGLAGDLLAKRFVYTRDLDRGYGGGEPGTNTHRLTVQLPNQIVRMFVAPSWTGTIGLLVKSLVIAVSSADLP